MIQRKSKIRQVDAQLKASLRLLQQMRNIHIDQFKDTIHPIMSVGDVTRLWSLIEQREKFVRALCSAFDAENVIEDDLKIAAVLGSSAGEQMARNVVALAGSIEDHIRKWEDGHSLSFAQIERYEATPLTIRDRTLAHAYNAFCRQVEAHSELLDALLSVYRLQFWALGDKLEYSFHDANI